MKKSFDTTVENVDQNDVTQAVLEQPPSPEVPLEAEMKAAEIEAAEMEADAITSDYAIRLKAAQDQAAQFLKDGRYNEAKRALKNAEQIKAEESKTLWLAEAKAERENALLLTNEGKLSEATQALERADELEKMAAGWKGRSKQFFASVRSRLPERSKGDRKEQGESTEPVAPESTPATEPVTESLRIVGLYSKIAAAMGLLPGGLLNFAAILPVQVLMVWRIARTFGQKAGKEQIRGVVLSLFTSVIPGLVGHGTGLAIASIPAMIAGTVVYFVATPILAYALTRAVGNVFIMHFESGGTLLTFDPKAFTEYFVNEFKKAGGTLRQTEEPAHETSATPA